jgi:hypothetical protein
LINRFRAPAWAGARHTDTRASMSKRKAAADGPSFVSLPGERLPARTLLYCALPKQSAQDGEADASDAPRRSARLLPLQELTLRMPRAPAPAGSRWCEFALLRAASVARGGCAAPDEASLRAMGHDGWRCADGHRVRLIDPEAHLRLIDDDKQSGVAQALLTDMFTRMQVRAPPPTSPRTVTAVRGGAGGAASHLPALAASELWPRSFILQS